jgi:hypothetical protein
MLTIQSMQTFDSMVTESWVSPFFRRYMSRLNPYGDENGFRFALARHNLLRARSIYDQESQAAYWNNLHAIDRIEAEMFFDVYDRLYQQVTAWEYSYIAQEHSDKILNQLRDPNFVANSKRQLTLENAIMPEPMTESDWNRGMARSDLYAHFAPLNTPFAHRYLSSFVEPGSVELKSYIALPAQANFLRHWRKNQSMFQMNIGISAGLLGYDLVGHARRFNVLEGVTAKKHILLTNEGIPKPNMGTFLAWACLCCFGMDRLDDVASKLLTGLCGFEPKLMLTYLLPVLPRTKEHQNHGAIRTDDSEADQSLISSSQAHKRNKYGQIEYGIWQMRTVLIGGPTDEPQIYIVTTQNLDNLRMNGHTIRDLHERMLPISRHYGTWAFSGLTKQYLSRNVIGIGFDPTMATQEPLTFLWSLKHDMDAGFRSFAKFSNLYMRFDEDERGWAAADKWSNAFERSAYTYMMSNQNEINKDYFETVMTLMTHPAPLDSNKPVTRSHKMGKTTFDVSNLLGFNKE